MRDRSVSPPWVESVHQPCCAVPVVSLSLRKLRRAGRTQALAAGKSGGEPDLETQTHNTPFVTHGDASQTQQRGDRNKVQILSLKHGIDVIIDVIGCPLIVDICGLLRLASI